MAAYPEGVLAEDPDTRRRDWIMTARSCLGALLFLGLMYVTISATREAATRAETHRPPHERAGERMIY